MSLQNKRFSPASIRKMGRWVVFSLLFFILGAIAVSFFTGIGEIIEILQTVTPSLLAGLVVLALANYVAHWLIWALLFKQLGVSIPLKKLAIYYIAGSALLPTPGKMGTAIRTYFLKKNHNVRYAKSASVMFMDMLTDLISVMGIMLICGWFWLASMYSGGFLSSFWAIFGVLLLLVVSFGSKPDMLIKIIKVVYKITGKKSPKFFAGIIASIRSISVLLQPKALWVTVLISALGWLTVCVAFWLVLAGMGQQVPFYIAGFIALFAILAGLASMLPGGLGGTEAIMVGMLISIDIPAPVAVASTVLTRFAVLWIPILLGFVALPFALKTSKRQGK